ncbi:MAG: argininosuccinate lyase [bacterium]
MKKKTKKLWGSAFDASPLDSTIAFTAGRDITPIGSADINLLPYDIWGNKAHCVMLYKQGLIQKKDAQKILKGLNEIENLAQKNQFTLDPSKEDVHTNIESWLTERYGIESIGKLHTARSRNDQSNLDTRLYLRDHVFTFLENNLTLIEALLIDGHTYKDYIIPGFTHHQHATPTTFGHILLAFASMLIRDNERFLNWLSLYDTNPLGAITAYGTTFHIDQKLTTQFFGFAVPETNSLDVITNRWEAEADFAFAITMLMNHLSLIAQTLIIFSTNEFGFVKLDDQYSTGSSIMPQKKNPDILEVVKAKSGLASGIVQSLLGLGKANFIGYNRDSQWSKYFIMDIIRECSPAPIVMKGLIETLHINKERMALWAEKNFIGATSLLEYITQTYNIPFREAKMIIEKAIKQSPGEDVVSYDALIHIFQEEKIAIQIDEKTVRQCQDPQWIVRHITSYGGPGQKSITTMERKLIQQKQKQRRSINTKKEKIEKGQKILHKEIQIIIK